jgi:hypothetical protein
LFGPAPLKTRMAEEGVEKCRDGSKDPSERWTPIISESLQGSFFNNLADDS